MRHGARAIILFNAPLYETTSEEAGDRVEAG